MLSTLVFSMSFVTCPIQQQTRIFFHLPLAADIIVEALLVALHIPCEIQLRVDFGFPHVIPECLDNAAIFLPSHLSLLLPLVHFLYKPDFCQEHLVHPCRIRFLFLFLQVRMDCS